MANHKKLRKVIGIIKDMVSITKATVSTKRSTKLTVAVLRATPHNLSSEERIAAVLFLGNQSRHAACTCVNLVLHRLHGTKDVYVAMNCLFTLHAIITKGSFYNPSFGGRNFLNLSEFRDQSDLDTRSLSLWVRWFGSVIEHTLMVSRFFGYGLSDKAPKEKLAGLSNKGLTYEIRVLVDFVEVISNAPNDNLVRFLKHDMVFELVRLISQDYRLIQHEIFVRVEEIRDRISGLSLSELTRLLGELDRFEEYKERLRLLFVNRNRYDDLWELVNEIKIKALEMVKENEERRSLVVVEQDMNGSIKLTRSIESVTDFQHWVKFDDEDANPLVDLSQNGELGLEHWVKFDSDDENKMKLSESNRFVEPIQESQQWVKFDSSDEYLNHVNFPLIMV